jgi:uncharacterized protein YceK
MVRLFFALFLLGGVCASVMAQDEVSQAPASEKSANEAVIAASANDQDSSTIKADEGTAGNTAMPVEEQAPAAPVK